MLIDLRSDTVTRPTKGMLEAMWKAPVGDDVFDEDPSVQALERKVADYFGFESALFCPSGTMSNQIAIRIQTQPQDEVICDQRSHIYNYEGGGLAYNSMVSVRLLQGERGILQANQIEEAILPEDIHYPISRLVSLENTVNKGGGAIYPAENIIQIAQLCKEKGLALHMDGARLFNALVAKGQDPGFYGKHFDTISVCFSKGLGAPVGSCLLGSNAHIKKAKRVRKVLGGGMRQAGYLAAACSYALDHHIERLVEDHQRAQKLGSLMQSLDYVEHVMSVETNIVICRLVQGTSPQEVLNSFKDKGILAVPFGKSDIRLVTHLDFKDQHLEAFAQLIHQIEPAI